MYSVGRVDVLHPALLKSDCIWSVSLLSHTSLTRSVSKAVKEFLVMQAG